MSNSTSVWQRLKQARLFRILVVYLGASWVVLQVSSTIVDAFKLPDWVVPSAVVLIAVGLVIVLATAWVQSLASTTAGEAAGALPTDWEIAPSDAIASLRRGRLPHLTWGRTLAGGVFMLALLFGGAGTYVGFMRGRVVGPSPAQASEAADGIAVVPFEVRGAGLDIWREGMMDLLTNGLDGVGEFRTIDSRTVMARWHEQLGDKAADLDATLAVARATGARYALEGSVVAIGPSVRLVANIHDVDTGKPVARGQSEGPAEDVLRLVDELAVGTMRSLLSAVGRAGAADALAETITTASLPALRAYLEGESHYRKGRFAEAVQSYERAVAEDSTFAIALVRLSESYGWLEDDRSERMREVGQRALAQAHRLSPRFQFILTGWHALNRFSADGVESLKEAVRKYPDDAGAWFLLAETYIHVGGATYGTDEEIWEALQQATTLDPNFAPYLVHVADFAVLRGDRALATQTLERYIQLSGQHDGVSHIELAIPLLLGSEQEVAAALQSAATGPLRALDIYGGTFARRHDHFDRDAILDSIFAARSSVNRIFLRALYAAGAGEVTRAAEIANDPAMAPFNRMIVLGYAKELWNVEPPAGAIKVDTCPRTNVNCLLLTGVAMAQLQQWPEQQRAITILREEAAAASDSAAARTRTEAAEVLRAAGLRRRGDVAGARELFTRYARSAGLTGERARLELAWMEAEANRPAEAIRHFRSVINTFLRPIALYGIAAMHEKLGQPEEARTYWAKLVTLTEKGEALPRIVEARQALTRAAQER